jgi:hypothetical protein
LAILAHQGEIRWDIHHRSVVHDLHRFYKQMLLLSQTDSKMNRKCIKRRKRSGFSMKNAEHGACAMEL